MDRRGRRLLVYLAILLTIPLAASDQGCRPKGFGSSGCNSNRTLTGDCGSIQSMGFPNTPYDNSALCEWNIQVSSDQVITLTFTQFDLEYSGSACVYDSVTIYNGADDKAPLLGRFCGSNVPQSITSSTNQLFIRFKTDNAFPGDGFYAFYNSSERPSKGSSANPQPVPKVLTDPTGIINTDDLTSSGRRRDPILSLWSIRSKIGTQLTLNWQAKFNAIRSDGNGYFKVYDGPSDTSASVQELFFDRGTRGQPTSGTILSTGHHLYIAYYVSSPRTANVTVIASYAATDMTPKISGCYSPQDFSVRRLRGQFSARNDTDQLSSFFCTALLMARETKHYLFKVKEMTLQGDPSNNCVLEGFAFYDGNNTNAPMYGPFCGSEPSNKPLPFVSSGDILVVAYSYLGSGQVVADYRQTDCKDLSSYLDANTTSVVKESCGSFRQPPLLTDTNFKYRLDIQVAEQNYIQMKIVRFADYQDVFYVCETLQKRCEENFEIYEPNGDNKWRIYSYCPYYEQAKTEVVTSSGNKVYVVYSTNCRWARSGFFFSYEVKSCDGMFPCDNGHCIDYAWLCDGDNDCKDNSDERDCEGCGEGQFRCKNGMCVSVSRRCDKFDHCGDGSDEEDCGDCTVDSYLCGNGWCIQKDRVCNGINDCGDNSDEMKCVGCGTDPFLCDNGECAYKAWLCDGDNDCGDNSDEMNCWGCGVERFTCDNGFCIERDRVCDGNNDCGDDSDEMDCEGCKNAFVCSNGECISKPWVCDGEDDCGDYSDERDCGDPIRPVRLIGGRSPHEGRVEVFYNGQWGTICDNMWDDMDAKAVCAQLGVEGVSKARRAAFFGKGDGPILSYNTQCVGNETALAECDRSPWFVHECDHSKDAGVICDYSPSTLPFADDIIGPCQDGFQYFNGSCFRYMVNDVNLSWWDAQRACRDMGSDLASIRSVKEMQFIKFMLNQEWEDQVVMKNVYIGLSDLDIFGKYTWVDGSPLSYTDWKPLFEPEGKLNERCVMMGIESAHKTSDWENVPCNEYWADRFLCRTTSPAIRREKIWRDTSFQGLRVTYDTCSLGWYLIRSTCYKLISSPDDRGLDFEVAQNMCRSDGGDVAVVDTSVLLQPDLLETIKFYLKYLWGLEKNQSVGVKASAVSHDSCQLIVRTMVDDTAGMGAPEWDINSRDCFLVSPTRYMCSSKPTEKTNTCRPEDYICGNGACVLSDFVCDGADDCGDNSDENQCDRGPSMFQCANGKYLPMAAYCDFIDQCGDKSDESLCKYPNCQAGDYRCLNGQCVPLNRRCDLVNDCLDGSDELSCQPRECKGILCSVNNTCISASAKCDGQVDCPGREDENGKLREDEQSCPGMPPDVQSDSCPFRCANGKCTDRSSLCIFDRDIYGSPRYCRDLTHLRYCERFQCPGMFKCERSYCIPLRMVCDGSRDCPGGEDEFSCESFSCPGHYRCKADGVCILQTQRCDDIVHCPTFMDDEKYCDGYRCPDGCRCEKGAVFCEGSGYRQVPNMDPQIRALFLSGNFIELKRASFQAFTMLGKLDLSSNSISNLPKGCFEGLQNVYELDLRKNRLERLEKNAFDGLTTLTKLYLDGNPLKEIKPGAFAGLNKIKSLNLSSMNIQVLGKSTFIGLKGLKELYLQNNKIMSVTPGTFADLRTLHTLYLDGNNVQALDATVFESLGVLQELYTDSFKICCMATHVPVCLPAGDEFSSCNNLLDDTILSPVLWILGLTSFFGNAFVIIWCLRTKEKSRIVSFLVLNLAIADYLMGVYMLIIAAVDIYYRGQYINYDDYWRYSSLCQFAGFLYIVSVEMSLYALTIITIDRVISVYCAKHLRVRSACLINGLGWLIAGVLAILPVLGLPYFKGEFYGRTGVCLPIRLTNMFGTGWQYVVTIFVAVDCVLVLILMACMMTLLVATRWKEKLTATAGEKIAYELSTAYRLTWIIVPDLFTWTLFTVLGISSLCGIQILPSLSAWTIMFVLPINAAMNPFLYLVSFLRMKTRKTHHISKFLCNNQGFTVELPKHNNDNGLMVGTEMSDLKVPTTFISDSNQPTSELREFIQTVDSEPCNPPPRVVRVVADLGSQAALGGLSTIERQRLPEITTFAGQRTEVDHSKERVTTEMRVLKKISNLGGHPNIVRQLIKMNENGSHITWILYTENDHDRLQDIAPQLTMDEVQTISHQISYALNFLHENNIRLNGISLDNILVERKPELRAIISDFSNAEEMSSFRMSDNDIAKDIKDWEEIRSTLV
ncbi:uncharacterized protein LOC144862181 isoform X4 [Branchiostoma floridae x Branchiostoma japonicum]